MNTDYQKNSTELKLKGKRSTRRPRPRWDDQLKRDLERSGIFWGEVIEEQMWENRDRWKLLSHT